MITRIIPWGSLIYAHRYYDNSSRNPILFSDRPREMGFRGPGRRTSAVSRFLLEDPLTLHTLLGRGHTRGQS